MLALLAAITVAAAPAGPTAKVFVLRSPLDGARSSLSGAAACKAAGRLQTAYEPALLYRQKDRDAGGVKRLIDLPEATACLLGGEAASSDGAAVLVGEGK